jgi:hypothetical protein
MRTPVIDANGFNAMSCGGDIKTHIAYAFEHTVQGADCVDTYRALVEVAEMYRVRHNYPVHVAQDTTALVEEWKAAEMTAEQLQKVLREQYDMELTKQLAEAKDLPQA